jgi:hypothetical protein
MCYLLLTRATISLPSFKLYTDDNDVLFDVLKSSDYVFFLLSSIMIQSRKKKSALFVKYLSVASRLKNRSEEKKNPAKREGKENGNATILSFFSCSNKISLST